MKFETYLAYVAVCSVAVIIPGPTNALILANGMRHGVRAGLLNVAGTQVGVGLMIVTVAIGLTSIVNAVGHWFEWIKLAGAVYLIILGGTAMVLAALSDSTYALISGRVAGRIDPKRVSAASRVGGVCLIGGGLWLALSRSKP
ncbi:MAG TPA: LysE family transporter [Steroidobacteraceae bacterium]|nr:LysE family transporter [Steroidobacteraceae bacterium]